MSSERKSFTYRLSQELIDEIIDFLRLHVDEQVWPYDKRWKYLSNCALVCKSFLPRSQMHLFSQITLPALPESRRLRIGDYSRILSLLNILENRPSLANHIQDLRLVLPGGHASWMYYTPEMLGLMEKINSTEVPSRLKLRMSTSPADASFKIPSTASHIKLIEFWGKAIAPYITSIHIGNITEVPLELLTMCTHLRDLTLMFTTFRQQTKSINRDSEHLSTPPKIEHLEYCLRDDPSSLSTAFTDNGFLDLSCLRYFTTYAHHTSDTEIEKIIASSRSTGCLESLVYKLSRNYGNNSPAPSTFLNLRELQHLSSLSQVACFEAPGTGGLAYTCMTLRTITSPKLRRFHLILWVNLQEELLGDADWETFVKEVLRISDNIDEGKLVLCFDVHCRVGDRNGHDPQPYQWAGHYIQPEHYAEKVIDNLIEGRLALLKNCPRISLNRLVTVTTVYNPNV